MKLHNLAPLMVSGALLAPAANAQHKTGLEFQFDLGLVNKEEDSTVEGDKSSLQFKQRRARWWVGGKFEDRFSYKFRFKFKDGGTNLSYVKVGYKLSDTTKVTFGRDFDPVPLISVVSDSYRMSDAVVSSDAAGKFNVGDQGVQLATDLGVGELKFGIANGKKIDVDGYGTTALSSFVLGASFQGSYGMFSPYIGVGFQNVPSEKVKATGLEFKGRSDVDLSVGAGVDLGATDLYFNFASHTEGEGKISAGGVETVAAAKKEITGFELKAAQSFTSKLGGALHFTSDNHKADGKNQRDVQKIGAQLYMYPYGNDKAYFTFSLANVNTKPEGGDSSAVTQAIVTFSARPSFVISE